MTIDFTREEIEFLLECAKFGSDPLEPAEYEVETILKLTNALKDMGA